MYGVVQDRLFGYDFFISYGHLDGSGYAEALYAALLKDRYRCFIDREEMPPGQPLSDSTRRGLDQSRVLLLVGTARVLNSDAVFEELELFHKSKRPIVPIDLFQTLEHADPANRVRDLLGDTIRLSEPGEGLVSGPSPSVLKSIKGSFRYTRRNIIRQRWLVAATVMFAILAVSAAIAAVIANTARIESDRQRVISLAEALAATAPRVQDQGKPDDVAALLVRQGYLLHQRYAGDRLSQMDEALRRILNTSYYSPSLSAVPTQSEALSVAYRKDSRILAAGYRYGTVLLWDVKNSKAKPIVLHGHAREVRGLQFCRQSDVLVSGGEDGTVREWDTAKSPVSGRVLFKGKFAVQSVTFDNVCSCVYAATAANQLVRVPVQPSGGEARQYFVPSTGKTEHSIWSVAISRTGTTIATAHQDGYVRLWDSTHLERGPVPLRGHATLQNYSGATPETVGMRSVAFSPVSDLLAAASEDNKLWLWDTGVRNPTPRSRTAVPRGDEVYAASLYAVAFSPDGTKIITGADDATVAVWETGNFERDPVILRGHDTQAFAVAFRPDGKEFASASSDKTVRLWNNAQGFAEPVIEGRMGSITGVEFLPDRDTLIVGDAVGRLLRWSISRGTQVGPALLERTPAPGLGLADAHPVTLALSNDGKKLAGWREKESIRVWKTDSFNAEPECLRVDAGTLGLNFAFTGDGAKLAAGDSDGKILIWNVAASTQEPVRIDNTIRHPVMAFTRDGRRLIVAGEGGELQLWDLPKFKTDLPTSVLGLFQAMAFSTPSSWVAISGDRGLTIGHPGSPTWVGLRGAPTDLKSLRFSPDERWLAGAGELGTAVLLWNPRQPELLPVTLRAKDKDISMITAFDPDGSRIIAGSWKGSVIIWDLRTADIAARVCDHVWRNLTDDEWLHFVGSNLKRERTCPAFP